MINNWLGLEYAWLLWVAYLGLCLLAKYQMSKNSCAYKSLKWKVLAGISMGVSLALIVIFPVACAIWFFGGCTLYIGYCMIRYKCWHPLKAWIGWNVDKNMRQYS